MGEGMGRGTVEKQRIHYMSCDVAKKKKVGPREMHRNLGTLTILNFLLSFPGCLLSLRCHTWDQTNQPLRANS